MILPSSQSWRKRVPPKWIIGARLLGSPPPPPGLPFLEDGGEAGMGDLGLQPCLFLCPWGQLSSSTEREGRGVWSLAGGGFGEAGDRSGSLSPTPFLGWGRAPGLDPSSSIPCRSVCLWGVSGLSTPGCGRGVWRPWKDLETGGGD